MKGQSRLIGTLTAAWLIAGLRIQAEPFVQSVGDEARTFAFNATFAQSFIAADTKIGSIGFSLFDANPFLGDLQFTVTLFQGQGFGGLVLGSATRTLSSLPPVVDWTPNFVGFDFSAITLNIGQSYTAQISSASGRGEAEFTGPYGDVYPGGIAYDRTTPLTGQDMTFEISTIPEPTSAGLWGLALALVLGRVATRRLVKRFKREGLRLKLVC
jgi:hypothetical protein